VCGICGFLGPADSELLSRMSRILAHRGPDSAGCWESAEASLACRRLAIIDLKTGDQPQANEDGRIRVVLNGTVYNYLELRRELEARGHRFSSSSDTEVLVHLYEDRGLDFLEPVNGEFALALWDQGVRRLVLARDRLGIRPLYHCRSGRRLLFASELKALLADRELPRRVNLDSLDTYIAHRYVPSPHTIFSGITRLRPGHMLVAADGEAVETAYWKLPDQPGRARGEDEWIEEFSDLLKDAVRLRLRSDVPVGAYLSGGLDSSTIVALAGAANREPVHTFSIGFGTRHDEISHAREVSHHFGTEHHEVQLTSRDWEMLPQAVWHLDEPLGDAIILPLFSLSRFTRDQVKVSLSGEGADELLGGYIHHLALSRIAAFSPQIFWFFPLIRALPPRMLDLLFPYPATLGPPEKEKILTYLSLLPARRWADQYLAVGSLFTRKERRAIYTEELNRHTLGGDLLAPLLRQRLEGGAPGTLLQRLIAQDLSAWLPDYTLQKIDRMGLAHGVECRVPFLDHRLVELVAGAPADLLIRGITNKYLLRRAAPDWLPAQVFRRRKQAFTVPLENRFSADLATLAARWLSPERIRSRGYFRPEAVRRLLEDGTRTGFLRSKQIMSLVILELWHQIYVDGSPPLDPPGPTS